MTKIFKTKSDFDNRADKSVNGVSEVFAKNNNNWKEMNETNEGCWNCSDCLNCLNCSNCWNCSDCSKCSKCSNCSDCWNCSDSWNCSNCSDSSNCWNCLKCSNCSNCSDCLNCSNRYKYRNKKEGNVSTIPFVENLHQKVYEAAIQPSALQMDTWHTNEKIEDGAHCGTTHCRAGWIVTLAGKEGRDLEVQTSTLFAAMQINKVSSEIRISPKSFYLNNDLAMKEIEEFAQKEKDLKS